MLRILHSDAHLSLTLDEAAGVVRYVRTREPFASINDLRALNDKLRPLIAMLPPGTRGLLIDVRDAPPRNDDPFEEETKRTIGATSARFPRRAVLVKSAVGRLQVHRMTKDVAQGEMPVFSDEAAALAYLRS